MYASILHANRAAAHSALGSLTEAIADCCRARALDGGYPRAVSRLAGLMLEVRGRGLGRHTVLVLERPLLLLPAHRKCQVPQFTVGVACYCSRVTYLIVGGVYDRCRRWCATPHIYPTALHANP